MPKETIRESILFERACLTPKTCSCLPGNVSNVRLWVSDARGGNGSAGGEKRAWGFERA